MGIGIDEAMAQVRLSLFLVVALPFMAAVLTFLAVWGTAGLEGRTSLRKARGTPRAPLSPTRCVVLACSVCAAVCLRACSALGGTEV